MKWDPEKARLIVQSNYGTPLDLTDFISDVEVVTVPFQPFDESVLGLKPLGWFTISGVWDDRSVCPLCKMRFTPEQHVPQPHVSINDGPSIPCCAACAVEHLT